MVAGVVRHAVRATATLRTSALLGLLRAVVVRGAQRLPVAGVPEQTLVPPVRDDVVNQRGRSQPPDLFAVPAERVTAQECLAGRIPTPVVRLTHALSTVARILSVTRSTAPAADTALMVAVYQRSATTPRSSGRVAVYRPSIGDAPA